MNYHEYIQWAVRIVQKMQAYLYVLYATETASLKHASQMIFDWDGKESYANKKDWEVHIGVTGVAIRYRAFINEDEAALIERVKFTIRHEICHLKYTAGKSYSWGVEAGSRAVYEYIASSLGIARRFRSSSDVEAFKHTLYSKGIYIADEAIYSIVSGIANSLCDGRIERIERSKDEGFKKDCIICRGENWKAGKRDFPDYSEVEDNAALRLTIILQQILSLAKFQVYQNGFTMAYAGTPLMDQVNDLMPEISEGYLARSTKGMAEACRKISCKLAPLIFDAVKIATADAEVMKQLEELIRSILSSIVNSANYGLVDTNAADDDTDPFDSPSALPFSNLVVTLPDEEYDRLMQKAKEGTGGNDGIQIRRENPKEENEKSASGSDGENSDRSESGKESKDSAVSDSGSPEADTGSSIGFSDESSEAEGAENSQAAQKKPQMFSGTPEEDALTKAMEEAANSVGADISSVIDSINQIATTQSNTVSRTQECTKTQPLDPENVEDICADFRELRRKYQLDTDLPADLKARADVLRRDTERYFERLREPNQRLKRNGKLDGKQLARLARNDTRVFMKKGKSKRMDCCYYILLDNSGSTGGKLGKKRIAECRAAAIQEEAYKHIFPMKIVAFDSDDRGVVHEVIKDWDERLHQNCCINFGVHGRDGYGNEDNFDIAIATRELLGRPERKKMLIVLSDGAPGDVESTKQAIADARKKGIKVIGIYFEEGPIQYAENFLYMYETDCIACEMTEIESSLSEVIRDFSRN